MENPNNITKNIVFESTDYEIVENLRVARSLGGKGFSAALRQIIREWHFWSEQRRLAERPEAPVYPSGPAAVFAGHGRE
jgi:hypothetical protein